MEDINVDGSPWERQIKTRDSQGHNILTEKNGNSVPLPTECISLYELNNSSLNKRSLELRNT